MTILDGVMIALGAWALGIFTAFFLYGWLDEREDTRAGIPWRTELDTCIDWSTRKPGYRA